MNIMENWLVVALLGHLVVFSWAQLVVNVKDKGGDVLQESIYANTSTDTITLDFMQFDGTLITQFIDFPNVCKKCFIIFFFH